MDLLERILTGDPDAVERLYVGVPEPWNALGEHLVETQSAAAPVRLVESMFVIEPDMLAWLDAATTAWRSEQSLFDPRPSPMARFRQWLLGGIHARWGASHPAAMWLRLEDLSATADEDALERARALVEDVEHAAVPAQLRSEALLLLARRAYERREIDEGIAAVRHAAALDPEVANRAARLEGALLLSARRVDEALERLAPVMTTRGPLFRGTPRHGGMSDPLDHALDEAATIAGWATTTTPEWVRALGGIAERGGLPWERFTAALAAMLAASKDPISDLEVVSRQARQRGMKRTALAAAELLTDRFPSDLEALSIAAPHLTDDGQHERLSRLYERASDAAPSEHPDKGRALLWSAELASDPHRAAQLLDQARPRLNVREDSDRARVLEIRLAIGRGDADAIDRGLVLLDALAREPRTLAEMPAGVQLVDSLVRALIARGDRRALAVQQKLVDAKEELWGECPSLSLERHNLGVLHARLGERDRARALIAAAVEDLAGSLGEDHPHTQLAQRSLAQLSAS